MPHAKDCFIVALALATGACHAGSNPPSPFPATPYTGSVGVRVSPAGGTAYSERGTGTARFTHAGRGRTQLSVIGAIVDPRGDAGFKIDGATTRDGWSGTWDDVRLDIGTDGRISGGGISHPQKFAFSGRVTPASFELVVDIELLEANKGGLARGTRMRFAYDLAQAGRSAEAPAAKRGRRADKADCKKLRYEVRPVPDPAGGTLVMRRMPVCKD